MSERNHKATYASDKRNGGYLIRVEGPNANMFTDREVPVTRRDGTENMETLGGVIWTGKDDDSGLPVALYKFEGRSKAKDEVTF